MNDRELLTNLLTDLRLPYHAPADLYITLNETAARAAADVILEAGYRAHQESTNE